MASNEIKKKWGTIFMGNRETSVQQMEAMQEPLRREQKQKSQAEEYMERVRARAADRAREILGAAYAERQKVLEEARADAARFRKDAELEGARLKAEGESARAQAVAELEKARKEREEAEKLRLAATDAGYQEGMKQSAAELNEFRADLGQSLGSLLRAIERERHQILDAWRDDIVELVQCAAEAGTGYVLGKEYKAVLRNLAHKSLDLLENRSIVSLRVHPDDEETINDMFRAARERFPELKQWVVSGDPTMERGGLVAESGTGRVDLRRENFQEMVSGVLQHLGLPEGDIEENADRQIREMVEKEVASIAAQTPELDRETEEIPADEPDAPESSTPDLNAQEPGQAVEEEEEEEEEAFLPEVEETENLAEMPAEPDENFEEAGYGAPTAEEFESQQAQNANPTLEDLEEELFPIDESEELSLSPEIAAQQGKAAPDKKTDPLAEGGFL